MKPALDLYMDLTQLEPDDCEHFLRAAAICVRRGTTVDAVNILKPKVKQFWSNPDALLGIAQVFASADCPATEVLELIYRARRLKLEDPEIHLTYVTTFMKFEDSSALDLKPTRVEIDTSIQLSSEQETLWYTILEEGPLDRAKHEFLSSDPVIQKLLGHVVGDIVQLKEGPYEQLVYKITEIQSKYVRAFQETLLSFSSWFPSHQGFHRMQIVDGDISPIFRATERAQRLQEEMLRLYKTRQLTLEGFAQSIQRNMGEAWGAMMQDENQIIASIGTPQEQAYHQRVIEAHSNVTIDLVALFTLTYLNLIDVLKSQFDRVYTAQVVVDVLIEEIEGLRQFGERAHGVVGRQGERYLFEQVSEQIVIHNIQFLERVLDFIRQNCQIMPITGVLDLEQKRFEESAFVIGRSSIASALVAKKVGTFLYSDDFLVRNVSKQWFSVDGCWTQPVLLSACINGLLSKDKYQDAIEALVLANYYYVSLNAPILMHLLAKHQWVVNSQVEKVFAPLQGVNTNLPTAVAVIAEFVHTFWMEPIPRSSKEHVLDLCLRTLVASREKEVVKRMLQHALRQEFALPGYQLQEVNWEIARWFEIHRSLGL